MDQAANNPRRRADGITMPEDVLQPGRVIDLGLLSAENRHARLEGTVCLLLLRLWRAEVAVNRITRRLDELEKGGLRRHLLVAWVGMLTVLLSLVWIVIAWTGFRVFLG